MTAKQQKSFRSCDKVCLCEAYVKSLNWNTPPPSGRVECTPGDGCLAHALVVKPQSSGRYRSVFVSAYLISHFIWAYKPFQTLTAQAAKHLVLSLHLHHCHHRVEVWIAIASLDDAIDLVREHGVCSCLLTSMDPFLQRLVLVRPTLSHGVSAD